MDAYLVLNQIEKKKRSKLEKLNEMNNTGGVSNVGLIISIIIGGYAAYLSYECNSKLNVPEFQKVLYSILAYLFGLFYLFYYFLFRYDTCHSLSI